MSTISKFNFLVLHIFLFIAFGATGAPLKNGMLLAKPQKESSSKISSLPTLETDKENEKILTNLIETAGWFPNLNVKVEKGLVVLTGQAKERSQLEWLLNSADRLPSVIAVIDHTSLEQNAVTDLTPLQEELNSWLEHFKKAVPRLLVGIVALTIFFFVGGFLHRLFYRLWSLRIENPFLLSMVAKFSLLPFYSLMFYMLLLTMGLQNLAMTIIGGTGVLGLVLGLSFKGIAENFFSGILLAMRSPFTKGDLIEIEDIRGVVQNLNMRGTTVMNNDGTLILIPNTMVVQSVIQNISANPQTRTSFVLNIDFECSISTAQKILLEVLSGIERVLRDPPPLVLVDGMDSKGVLLKVYFWFDIRKASLVGSRSRVMSACKDALQVEGISILDTMKVEISDNRRTPDLKVDTSVDWKSPDDQQQIEQTHTQMMRGTLPEESLKKMAREATLPGNSQSPDLLKNRKET